MRWLSQQRTNHKDGFISSNRDEAEPTSEVFEDRSLREIVDGLIALQHYLDARVSLRQHVAVELVAVENLMESNVFQRFMIKFHH